MRDPIGFRKFAQHALPEWFTMPHDRGQLGAIVKITRAVFIGGMHCVPMEQGDGKTTLAAAAVLWATFEGLRKFPLLLCGENEVTALTLKIAEAKARETHGRVLPFFESDQVVSIAGDFSTRSRPVPGVSRPGKVAGGVVQIEMPDLLVIDDPGGDAELLDAILLEKIPAMAAHPACVLLGSPQLVARIAGKGGWLAD